MLFIQPVIIMPDLHNDKDPWAFPATGCEDGFSFWQVAGGVDFGRTPWPAFGSELLILPPSETLSMSNTIGRLSSGFRQGFAAIVAWFLDHEVSAVGSARLS